LFKALVAIRLLNYLDTFTCALCFRFIINIERLQQSKALGEGTSNGECIISAVSQNILGKVETLKQATISILAVKGALL